jgi:hypothetical protein
MHPLILVAMLLLANPAAAAEKRSAKVLSDFQKANPCPATGKTTGACPGWIKDHKWPLCAGGPDVVWNLQWQSVADAAPKDALEKRVCAKLRKVEAVNG